MYFYKILMAPGIGVLPLLDGFRPYLCPVLGKMIVKTTTRCQWEMSIKEVSGKVILESSWHKFAVSRNLKIATSSSSKSSTQRSTRWSSSTTPAMRLLPGTPEPS
jgi:hypothetical protein